MKGLEKSINLPSEYENVVVEDMRNILGGRTIPYHISYCTKKGALAGAVAYKKIFNFNKISTLDLAAEIWFHAYAYYRSGPMIEILKKTGFLDLTNTPFWKSLKNGIDVVDGVDNKKECGVQRYKIFRAAYALAPTFLPGV